MLAATLSACGGGGGSSPQSNAPATPPAIIAVYGDSTAVGVDGTTIAPGQGCPPPTPTLPHGCTFVKPPGAYVNIDGYAVEIRALTGGSLLDRYHGAPGLLPWADEMASHPARVIIIALGINDSYSTLDVPLYAATLATMIDMAHARGKLVVLQTSTPTFRPSVADYMAAMRQVAADKAAPFIDIERLLPAYLPPDGLHPDAATYKVIGEYMQVRLMEILRSV